MSILFGSNSEPSHPIAHKILPQFASEPNIAALTIVDVITAFDNLAAVSSVFAPSTTHSINLVAPSPSLATNFASSVHI